MKTLGNRRLVGAGLALGVLLAAFVLGTHLLSAESFARTALADLLFILIELVVLILCWKAYRGVTTKKDRRLWFMLGVWLVANIVGDAAWAVYEVGLRAEVPFPSVADVGYLVSYPLAFASVVAWTTWKGGRLTAVSAGLDATMFTLGITGLSWPLLLAPIMASASSSAEAWWTLAYPIGDLLVVLAMTSVALASTGIRVPRSLWLVCFAFLINVIADTAYFAYTLADSYKTGSWIDTLWVATFCIVGAATLAARREGERSATAHPVINATYFHSKFRGYLRLILPYLALPMIFGMLYFQLHGQGAIWHTETSTLIYLALGFITLLIARQFIVLHQNRKLSSSLTNISAKLEERVARLDALTHDLHTLTEFAGNLNSLRTLDEVLNRGLAYVCAACGYSGGCIVLKEHNETERIAMTRGEIDPTYLQRLSRSSPTSSADQMSDATHVIPLRARGAELGSLQLFGSPPKASESDLLLTIAAQLGTAMENVRQYEEVVRLAEVDPLTGLLNHRGVHERLVAEIGRTQRQNGELSLAMIDLDDFKILNDTFGHPAGDDVLRQLAEVIRTVIRTSDVTGRVGGDEFMLILPDTSPEGALRLAQRVHDAVACHPFLTPHGHSIPLRLSIGVASYPLDASSANKLAEVADANLYLSKQRGGHAVTSSARDQQEQGARDRDLFGLAGGLLNMVGVRDHYTRHHSEQVVVHSLALAQALGLSKESQETLRLAAMLHDVGKVDVPARLLRKPAALTPQEEDAVRQHVTIGGDIVKQMPRLAGVLEAVLTHHERHDGTGYPAGMHGNDIPLLGRVLAVADAYSAMTTDRPYRRGMDADEAKMELQRVAGTQLDPELVAKFIEILDAPLGVTSSEHTSVNDPAILPQSGVEGLSIA